MILLFNRRTCSCSSSGRCSVLKWVWWNKLNAVFLAHPFLVKQSKEALAVYVLHCILHLGWGSWCISPHRSWGARRGTGSTCFLLASGHRFSLCARAGRREPGINKQVAFLALTLSVLYPNNDPHDSDPISQFLNLCLELIRSIHGHQTDWMNLSLPTATPSLFGTLMQKSGLKLRRSTDLVSFVPLKRNLWLRLFSHYMFSVWLKSSVCLVGGNTVSHCYTPVDRRVQRTTTK